MKQNLKPYYYFFRVIIDRLKHAHALAYTQCITTQISSKSIYATYK
uniref:Uncharacterized protein n=1 Tax=Rhizophora mucronata TaxID=61149 RepID=A0A2P2QVM3_RHIMU